MDKNIIKKSLTGYPKKQGLYNPIHEKDACGFGFIANLDNIPKHIFADCHNFLRDDK